MSFTVFLGNLPTWVTADDIKGWLTAENLVADAIKVIRNPETQESKGFAFIEAPNAEEMNSIIRRFDRAPLEDRLLRANPAQPPKPKGLVLRPGGGSGMPSGPEGRGGSYGGGAAHGSTHGSTHGSSHGASQASSQTTPPAASQGVPPTASASVVTPQGIDQRPPRRAKKVGPKRGSNGGGGPQSAFAEELAKAL
jgi:RNA recognition motif-containing protein